MPTYDYYCSANAQTVEVRHRMSESLTTWGEVCAKANVNPGDTPLDTPVKQLITGGNLISGKEEVQTAEPMTAGSRCAHGRCGCA